MNYTDVVNSSFDLEDTKELFKQQIDNFIKLSKIDLNNRRYAVGDEVLFDKNTLIHGTRISINNLKNIKEEGLIAPEFLGKEKGNKKKPYVVEFWKIDDDISLEEYIKNYCGVTIDVYSRNGEVKDSIISSFENLENNIIKLSKADDFRDYIIYQNQEQRFLPNSIKNDATMAFIMRGDSEDKFSIIKNDIFDKDFDEVILKEILPEWFIKKYINGSFDHHETGRERAIIFGVPSNFIEGIMVCDEFANDEEKLCQIKNIFEDIYICNINGKVIK